MPNTTIFVCNMLSIAHIPDEFLTLQIYITSRLDFLLKMLRLYKKYSLDPGSYQTRQLHVVGTWQDGMFTVKSKET